MIYRQKKRDYECKVCGYILSDDEVDENNGLCNRCLIGGSKKEEVEEDYDYWLDYK